MGLFSRDEFCGRLKYMPSKLTSELRDEIAATPHQAVPVVDEQSGKVYYVVDDEFLFGQVEQNGESRKRLKALIEEGFASGKVGEAQAHQQMRSEIDKHRNHSA